MRKAYWLAVFVVLILYIPQTTHSGVFGDINGDGIRRLVSHVKSETPQRLILLFANEPSGRTNYRKCAKAR
ncbi:hypothetical protein ACFL0Q_07890 [Thermodesulfobacteriota bacterium]